jgi:CRISPR-associated protein Csm1
MEENEFHQVALAGLTSETGMAGEWESSVRENLKGSLESYKQLSDVAARLSAGTREPGKTSPRLENILASIKLNEKKDRPAGAGFYKPVALSLTEDGFFPVVERDGDTQKAAQHIAKEIENSLPKNYREDEAYLEEVLSVLHRTTANLPSAYSPDVSYYDQQRMTAALAVCLSEKNPDDVKQYLSSDKFKDEKVALLVGGDISGIQDFIYTITAKGAAKSLRGRSFYLQILTEAVLRFVLRELKTPYTNVIYSGGGHFFLLAPLSKAKELNGIQQKITQAILKHHGTSLYLALGWAEVPVSGFMDGKFPEYWGEMHRNLAHRKQKRYSELGADIYKRVFKPKEWGGNPDDTCDACKEDHRKVNPWAEGGDQDRICTLCESFIEEFGRKLPSHKFVALRFSGAKSSPMDKASDALAEFGMAVQFLNDKRDNVNLDAGQIVIWSLDDAKDAEWSEKWECPKWIRYTARQVPRQSNGEILQFDELLAEVEGGFERLGVLRMDVDNLGEIFKSGLGKNATLTRLASLSFRISLFFEGWLKKICEEEANIYTVYSGGDDVFLIGPWDVMPGLAQKIKDDFARYSSENPYLHLSAGLTFINKKYPVYQAAEDAEKAIDGAKDMDGKDGFTFLGRSWKWATFSEIAAKQERLSGLVKPASPEKKPAPQALLQILQQLALEEEGHKKPNGIHVWGRWIWMGMYQLTRMGEQNSSAAEDIKSIRDGLAGNGYKEINQWGIAARWTQLKERKKS